MVKRGFSDVIGSWKMKPIFEPRILRISLAVNPDIFLPSRYTSPLAITPGGLNRSITALPTVDLPAPDSPTIPTISPRSIEKDNDFTAA